MTARATRIFNKGSMLPSILDLETELSKSENEARNRSETVILDARQKAVEIIEQARSDVKNIEREEHDRLLNAVDDRINELEKNENLKLKHLRDSIDKRRGEVFTDILAKVVPGGMKSSDD